MGMPEDTRDLIVTSGDATVEALRLGWAGKTCHHIGPERDFDLFDGIDLPRVPLEKADFILCSGLFDDAAETPDDYAETLAAGVSRGLPMLCANPDVVVDRGEKRLYCAGAIAAAYEQAGGAVQYFGKPHAPVYERAMLRIADAAGRDIPKTRVLAIGDGPATDILGAERHGYDSLFVAGGLAADTLLDGDAIRDGALQRYLADHGIVPDYAIAYLR